MRTNVASPRHVLAKSLSLNSLSQGKDPWSRNDEKRPGSCRKGPDTDRTFWAEYPSQKKVNLSIMVGLYKPKKVNLSIMVGLYKPKKVKGYLLSYYGTVDFHGTVTLTLLLGRQSRRRQAASPGHSRFRVPGDSIIGAKTTQTNHSRTTLVTGFLFLVPL